MKFNYDFFFKRKNITQEDFFQGILTLEEAVNKLDDHNIVGYNLAEIESIVGENNNIRLHGSRNTSEKSKHSPRITNTGKKSASGKTAKRSTPRSSKSKATASKKAGGGRLENDEDNEQDEKDASYFKTWKVPYVEPE